MGKRSDDAMAGQRNDADNEYTGRDERYLIDDDGGADPFGVPPPMSSGSEWAKQAEAVPEPSPATGAGISGETTQQPQDVAVGDEVYEEAAKDRDPLAEMYVKNPKLGQVGSGKLTIEDGLAGLPPEPKRPLGRLIVGVAIGAALLCGAIASFAIERTYVDENLRDVPVSFARWAAMRMAMDGEAAARQRLSPDDRAYLVTRSRILDLFPAVYDYFRSHGEFPRRVADLKATGLIEDRLGEDGWQVTFRIETNAKGEPVVSSAGLDHSFGTPDDIRYAGGEFVAPPRYEDADAIPFVER